MASLKGITSTNKDPSLCALCSETFPKGMYSKKSVTIYCCGKRICLDCNNHERIFEATASSRAYHCILCKRSASEGISVDVLKKHAKRGQPWAQFYLAIKYGNGKQVTKSDFEAVRWFRKAASNGHPDAWLRLGIHCLNGIGCDASLSETWAYAEKAMFLDSNLDDVARDLLISVGARYSAMDLSEEAKLVLTPLAEAGISDAQYNLGAAFFVTDDFAAAEPWLVSAALKGNRYVNATYYAMVCCQMLGKFAQSRFWLGIATKQKKELTIENVYIGDINKFWANFRGLRNSCGGCGAALDGTMMRKICSQCKAYCYCGRGCQKLHWNRQGKDGHRGDCMRVLDLKEKMAKMRGEKKSSGD